MTSPRRAADRPLLRRDADGQERTAPSWETLTERLIREAQEEGRFDDLPGQGQRLAIEEDVYAGDMAVAHHLLRNAGAAPPWIELDKEVRRLEARIASLLASAQRASPAAGDRLGRELDELISAHDDATRSLEGIAPTPRQQRPRLDRESLRERLRCALENDDASR